MSASRSTIIGSLPPSSSDTGVSVSAARAITFLPVFVDPVNMIMSDSSTSAAPVSPRPVATRNTSSGAPAAPPASGREEKPAVGRPRRAEALLHEQRGQRRDLARLEDHRVAGGERRD